MLPILKQLNLCLISAADNFDTCHGSAPSYSMTDMSDTQRELLLWRSGIKEKVDSNELCVDLSNSKICEHHFKKLLTYYESKQKNCCNPLNIHRYVNGRKKPKGHVTIQLETAKQLLPKSVSTIPGLKVCNQCWKDIQMMLRDTAENQSMPLSDESSETFDYSDTEENECSLNVSLQSCGVSPFKSKGLRATQRSVHADKKIDKVTANLRSAFESKGIAIPPKPSNCDVNDCDSNSAAKDDLDALM